jgi:hypothetical protein
METDSSNAIQGRSTDFSVATALMSGLLTSKGLWRPDSARLDHRGDFPDGGFS